MATAAERIKEGMELRNLKQSDLAKQTGISKGALSSYLSGKYIPKQNNIKLIAKALHVSESWLLGLDISTEQTPDSGLMALIEVYSSLSPDNQKALKTYAEFLHSRKDS